MTGHVEHVVDAADDPEVAILVLARAVTGATSHTTTSGVLMGTVAYLSPEQVTRGVADPRSDVYAAGILLFEMLTGVPPYFSDSPLSVAYRHVNEDVPPPSQVSSLSKPASRATSAAPRAPAAGPESTVVIGWWTTSSADSTPPLDFMT